MLLAKHEIRHQNPGAKKPVIVRFPAKRTASVQIRDLMHGTKTSVTTFVAHHVGVRTCGRQTGTQSGPIQGSSGFLQIHVHMLFATSSCIARNPHLLPQRMPAETSLPSADWGGRSRGCSIFIATHCCLKSTSLEQVFSFFLGIASLHRRCTHLIFL